MDGATEEQASSALNDLIERRFISLETALAQKLNDRLEQGPAVPRLMDTIEVCFVLGIDPRTLKALRNDAEAEFPKPITMSARILRWEPAAVQEWIEWAARRAS